MKLAISLLTTCTREYYEQLHPCKSDNMKETDQYHKPLKLDLGERYNMNSLKILDKNSTMKYSLGSHG